MQITVRLFGPEAEITRQSPVTLCVDGSPTCGNLRELLTKHYPRLAPRLPSCRFAVNHEFVGDEHLVEEQDEVALIGLVSGG